jgi:hypothetical protein
MRTNRLIWVSNIAQYLRASLITVLLIAEWTALVKNTLASFKVVQLAPSATAANELTTSKYVSREITVSSSPRTSPSSIISRKDLNGQPSRRDIARRRHRRASAPAAMEFTLSELSNPQGSDEKSSFRFSAFRSPGGSWRRSSALNPRTPQQVTNQQTISPGNAARALSPQKTVPVHCALTDLEGSDGEPVVLPDMPKRFKTPPGFDR